MKLSKNHRGTSVRRDVSPYTSHSQHSTLVPTLRTTEKQRSRIHTYLSPYMGELERKRKARSVITEHPDRSIDARKVSREASSKRFRIQECIYHPNKTSSDALKTVTAKSDQAGSSKNIRQLVELNLTKYQHDVASYTEKPMKISGDSPSRPTFYSDLYDKLKAKNSKREGRFRKGKYIESSLDDRSELNGSKHNNAVLHLGYTTNNLQGTASGGTTISHDKQERRNFRRNKFDVQSQALDHSQKRSTIEMIKYNSTEIEKKESNSSLIRELQSQTQKDLEMQERTAKIKMNRLLEKSLEKSTEEYFKDGYNHRKLKSRNDIEVYISTVNYPSKNRNSQASTLQGSDARRPQSEYISQMMSSKNKSLTYDFDIEEDVPQGHRNGTVIEESPTNTENEGIEESIDIQDTDFNRQRKAAERARLEQCDVVGVSWSEQEMEFNKLHASSN